MRKWGILLMISWMLGLASCSAEETDISLQLVPTTRTTFNNAIPHYVYFDAEVKNAETLTIQLFKPSGVQTVFRNRRHVNMNRKAVRRTQYQLKKGENRKTDLNILFRSESDIGRWRIEVTASAAGKKPCTETLEIEIQVPEVPEMGQLGEVHAFLEGEDGNEAVPVREGKIRFIAQNPKDPTFVKEYWLSKKYDLRESANKKCTRAVFSMALSWLGIDCTPVRMSEMLWGEEIYYNFDPVCTKLGNVKRRSGDLETLWKKYETGDGSPIFLHFTYEGGAGMHALLLVSRDRMNPELFYCVTSSTPVNTSAYPDGREKEHVIPILIEEGKIGAWIQSPMLEIYNKGKIDEIWQWYRTDLP